MKHLNFKGNFNVIYNHIQYKVRLLRTRYVFKCYYFKKCPLLMEVKNGNQHRTPYQRLKFTTCTGHRTNYIGQISVDISW